MRSRSERYKDDSTNKPSLSRTKKNAYLYDDINNRIGLEVVDFDNKKIDFSSMIQRKEENKEEKEIMPSVCLEEEKEKVYDINSVLEEAKKNRTEYDELEKKRKLQNEEYNVLNDLNRKYITDKEKRKNEVDEEQLQELINTITSNTLAKDIKEKELFSDLMATSSNIELNDVTNGSTSSNLEEIKNEDGKLVNSFYTKSMDLTEQDFVMSDEFRENNSKLKIFLIVFVVILILAIIGVTGYFLLKWRNIV